MEIVHELRKHTSAVFRVDANCGWYADKAIALSHELKSLNVEFIEQPFPRAIKVTAASMKNRLCRLWLMKVVLQRPTSQSVLANFMASISSSSNAED